MPEEEEPTSERAERCRPVPVMHQVVQKQGWPGCPHMQTIGTEGHVGTEHKTCCPLLGLLDHEMTATKQDRSVCVCVCVCACVRACVRACVCVFHG